MHEAVASELASRERCVEVVHVREMKGESAVAHVTGHRTSRNTPASDDRRLQLTGDSTSLIVATVYPMDVLGVLG